MGRDSATGEIIVIDEMMTPDSSRYWIEGTYQAKIEEGKEPDNIDKEVRENGSSCFALVHY